MTSPFELRGVVHLVRPAGRSASNLEALRVGIEHASASSLFYHVHHPRLRHRAAVELPPDDLSAWVNGVVQDRDTAERLSFAVQTYGQSVESLREGLLAALEAVPGRARSNHAAPEEGAFVFLEMDSVAVGLDEVVHDCDEMIERLGDDNSNVFFYHLIERPWLEPTAPSLADWARAQGQPRLAAWLEECAHGGRPLAEEQRRLGRRWRRSHVARRVADAAGEPESDRREGARRVIRGLVRRLKEG